MIAPYTFAMHGLMAILCLGSMLYLFTKKSGAGSDVVENYFNWFLFFFLYNIALAAPLLIFQEISAIFAYIYLLALLFLGVAGWNAFWVAMALLLKNAQFEKVLSRIYIAGIIVSVFLQFLFFEFPRLTPGGKWILWYSGPVAYFYIFFMFAAGWTFAGSFIKDLGTVASQILKIRGIILATGAFVLPLAAASYFRAPNINYIYFAFGASIAGLFLLLSGNIMGFFSKKPTT